MARLPDYTALGARDPRSVRGLPSYPSTSPVAEAQQKAGQAIQKVGATLFDIAKQAGDENDQMDYGRAQSYLATNKINIDNKFAADQDYPTLQARYQAELGKTRDDAAAMIRNPRLREKFRLQTEDDLARGNAWATNRTRDKERDVGLASLQTRLDEGQSQIARAKDDGDREKLVQGLRVEIDAAEKKGWLSAQSAEKARRAFAEGAAVSVLEAMPAADRIVALGGGAKLSDKSKAAFEFFVSQGWAPHQAAGIVGNLIAESTMNSRARNAGDGSDGSDSLGIAQWNAERATRLKQFAASKGADWHDFKTQLEFVQLELKTSEGKAGAALASAANAREAAEAMIMYERPAGSQRGAQFAHNYRGRVRASEEAHAAYGGGAAVSAQSGSAFARYLPEDRRRSMLERADREEYSRAYEIAREEERQRKTDAVNLQSLMRDDLASIERSGTGIDETKLSPDRVRATLGEEGYRDWLSERARARRGFEALDGIDMLPEGEVERRLQGLEPKPGTEGYADDMRAYDKARKKADAFLQARRADPALAVEAFPAVKEARAAAVYEGEGESRRIKPESAQQVVRARLAAQSQLGISEPLAVTRSEARVIARQLRAVEPSDPKDPSKGDLERIDRTMRALRATYGDLTDEVLAATFQHGNVNRDLSVLATDVLNNLAQGTAPPPSTVKAIDTAKDQQSLGDAMKGQQQRVPMVPWGFAAQAPGATPAAPAAGPAEKPAQGSFQGAPTRDNLRTLLENRNDPGVMAEFDMTFGPGTAKRALTEMDRRLGTKGGAK